MYFFKNVLYVVGSPIGNFFDFSNRAIFILKKVDFIIAEDSRKIGFLLSFLNFSNKIIVLNVENEKKVCLDLIGYIKNGFSAALVSDSGTPCISDPGHFLIKSAYINKIKVVAIPGSSVVSTVLSICSFNVNRFIFDGFLPKKKIYKEIFFRKLISENRTCIFFESGERLLETLFLMKLIFNPYRLIFIAKDLTKKFESIFFFKLLEFDSNFIKAFNFFNKGEFVVLLAPLDENNFISLNLNNSKLFNLLEKDFFLQKIIFSSFFKIKNILFF
jgi:16S rRNA (cytidine1402-2'-O)-methyltransferase